MTPQRQRRKKQRNPLITIILCIFLSLLLFIYYEDKQQNALILERLQLLNEYTAVLKQSAVDLEKQTKSLRSTDEIRKNWMHVVEEQLKNLGSPIEVKHMEELKNVPTPNK